MSELRLVPAALAVWAASLAGIVWGPWAALAAVLAACACIAVGREVGQVILVAGLGGASAAVTTLRLTWARAFQFRGELVGEVSGAPRQVDGGGFLLRVRVEGHPGLVPAFVRDLPEAVSTGATVSVSGRTAESTRPGLAQVVVSGDARLVSPPTGMAAWAGHVRQVFSSAVERAVGPRAEGLIPGMVLGDTSLQSPNEQADYVAAGLSHLSAVSGSNVAVVTSAAAVAAAALGLGLRGRIAFAAAALTVFACLVGPEPSVLRASVTGLVGLAAVLASSLAEPVHALCLAVIGLVLVDSDLAVSYGFALSVAATAGIVAVSPLLYRALAPTGWPDILVRALAVAVAADVATMPIVALMAGQVSLVSVVANVLAAPAAAPVTVLGLVAVVLALLPGGLEAPVLWVIEPMAAWIRVVAGVGAHLPAATVAATPGVVLVAYGWVVAGLVAGRPRVTIALTLIGVAAAGGLHPWQRPLDVTALRAHVVPRESAIDPVPAGTQLVVVLEGGRPHERPVVTPFGVPVLYPNRDGPVRVYRDGTQRAESGAF